MVVVVFFVFFVVVATARSIVYLLSLKPMLKIGIVCSDLMNSSFKNFYIIIHKF